VKHVALGAWEPGKVWAVCGIVWSPALGPCICDGTWLKEQEFCLIQPPYSVLRNLIVMDSMGINTPENATLSPSLSRQITPLMTLCFLTNSPSSSPSSYTASTPTPPPHHYPSPVFPP
jgi:hypothetical protein